MKNTITIEWFKAAGIRALKAFAESALSMLTVGMAITDVSWWTVLSIAAGAGIYSILISLKGLPEVGTDGTLQIDRSNPARDTYRFSFNNQLTELSKRSLVKFKVDPNAKLSRDILDEEE